jgi:hypothetical protein
MAENATAKSLIDRYDNLKSHRYTWERHWQEIRDLVRPDTSDFQRKEFPGQVRTHHIWDGTAPQALEELGSGLQSFLTSPAERWFEIKVDDEVVTISDPEALAWLEAVSDLIYDEYSRDATNFNSAIQEIYQDLGAFGTGVLNQEWSGNTGTIRFKAIPLADSYVEENADGTIDTLFRKVMMTRRQMDQMFGEQIPEQTKKEKDDARKWEVVHATMPREDRKPQSPSNKNMPFASIWFMPEFSFVTKESGFRSLPYHVPRWTKIAGEMYGRSPALKCLPDIKMLNRMEYTNIKAAQKAVDPPLLLPHEAFIKPIKTAPGSLNFKEPGSEEVQSLEFSGQWPVALEITQQKREHIRACFFSDFLRLEKERVEMTAFEVQDRRDEKLRFLAPMLGRIQSELLSPMIARSYELLLEHGKIPAPPPSLAKRRLKVGYVSPASRAQLGMKAITMGRYIQELLPVAQVNAEVLDSVDFDAYAQQLAFLRGTSRTILRGEDEILRIREERQQAQQAQQIAETLQPASDAIKNISQANEAGNIF